MTAREVNAKPWEPPPGMEKQRCPWCRYLFAAAVDSVNALCGLHRSRHAVAASSLTSHAAACPR